MGRREPIALTVLCLVHREKLFQCIPDGDAWLVQLR